MKLKNKIKKVYLIHGWGFNPEENWYPWLKKELSKKGAEVKIFDMPNTENPKIEEWVSYLNNSVKEIDEQTYFVGHSIGCQTIMRFLEKLPKHKKIAGCVFVAPWFNLINLEAEEIKIAHPWINSIINFGRIKEHCDNFLAIFSNDDPSVHIDESNKFKENIGAKIIIKNKMGHFDNAEKIPEILEFIK